MRKNKNKKVFLLLLLLLMITVGYAGLSQVLKINGTSKLDDNIKWDVHFKEDSAVVTEGSVSNTAPTIDTNKTTVTYNVDLKKPNDFYEFTVDVVNEGTIDAMLNEITKTILEGNSVADTAYINDYIDYTVTYSDGVELNKDGNKDLLKATTGKETLKVRVAMKDVDTLTTPKTLTFKLQLNYVQADSSAKEKIIPEPVSFAEDSWIVINSNVVAGNISKYHVGDTKKIKLPKYYHQVTCNAHNTDVCGDGTPKYIAEGEYTLRIANTSTPAECNTEEFSETACGFVIEFEDIITNYIMSINSTTVVGWPTNSGRNFINNNIYNMLPSDLKKIIKDTNVISGAADLILTSTDKLYLLSPHEVFENGSTNNYNSPEWSKTRQLDYYKNKWVTTDSYSGAIKKLNGKATNWATSRAYKLANTTGTAYKDITFLFISGTGDWSGYPGLKSYGLSPAFRIG